MPGEAVDGAVEIQFSMIREGSPRHPTHVADLLE
jgi:hypothetical protein